MIELLRVRRPTLPGGQQTPKYLYVTRDGRFLIVSGRYGGDDRYRWEVTEDGNTRETTWTPTLAHAKAFITARTGQPVKENRREEPLSLRDLPEIPPGLHVRAAVFANDNER